MYRKKTINIALLIHRELDAKAKIKNDAEKIWGEKKK